MYRKAEIELVLLIVLRSVVYKLSRLHCCLWYNDTSAVGAHTDLFVCGVLLASTTAMSNRRNVKTKMQVTVWAISEL